MMARVSLICVAFCCIVAVAKVSALECDYAKCGGKVDIPNPFGSIDCEKIRNFVNCTEIEVIPHSGCKGADEIATKARVTGLKATLAIRCGAPEMGASLALIVGLWIAGKYLAK